jgi:hypothetical protein
MEKRLENEAEKWRAYQKWQSGMIYVVICCNVFFWKKEGGNLEIIRRIKTAGAVIFSDKDRFFGWNFDV